MKTRLLVLAALVWIAAGCATVDPYRSVRIELPGVTPFNLEDYREILVVPFKEEAPPPAGFALAKETTGYLVEEIERDFKGRVVTLEATEAGPPAPDDQTAWKEKGAAHPQALFLTGTVRLSSEVRKAINENGREIDGPFKQTGSGLSERRLYTLDLSLGFIDAATGRSLFRQEYKESKTYVGTKQPAEFAFFELAQRARLKFLRTILGAERLQERFLLIR